MAKKVIDKNLAKERLAKYLATNDIKVFTDEDFNFPQDEATQSKIRAEVDEFLQMRKEWRKEDLKLEEEKDK